MTTFTTKTRYGYHVEIVYVAPLGKPLEHGEVYVGIVTDGDNSRSIESWDANGRFHPGGRDSAFDIELPLREGTPELAMAAFHISQEAWDALSITARNHLMRSALNHL